MRHRTRMTQRLFAVAALTLWGCGDAPLANTAAPQEAPGHDDVVVRRVVWPNPDGEADPRWATPSPDGTLQPYIDWTTGDVAIRDLSAGTSRPLTSTAWEGAQYPGPAVVSPDGQQVAYPWSNRDFFFELRIVGLDGSGPRVVYSNREAQLAWAGLDWSSDGAQILALLQRGDLTYQIALISVATGSPRILRSLDWRPPEKMALSPDGRFVLYDLPPAADSRQRDIYLLSTDATSNTPLVADSADDFVLGWVDNQHVLFASDRSGTPGAYLQRVRDGRAEGGPQLVKSDLWRITPGGATRNGSYYYTVNTASTDIFTTTLDPATGRVLTSPTLIARDGSHPAWSRDGRYLAYVSTPSSPSPSAVVLRIRSVDTGETRELYPRLNMGSNAGAGDLRWFPDSRALLVRARDLTTNRMGLFRVDSQTGAVSVVCCTTDTTDTRSGLSPVLSPDGTTLFFVRLDLDRAKPRSQIVGVDLEGRTERVVVSTEGPIIAIAVSPDGQRLAFEGMSPEDSTQPGGLASLYVVPASGGEGVRLHRFEELHGMNWVHGEVEWSADGRYVFFATMGSTEPPFVSRLWRVPAGGGQAERLDQLGDSSFSQFSMRMHPNGREVAFSAGSPGGIELWVMENLFALTRSQPTAPSAR